MSKCNFTIIAAALIGAGNAILKALDGAEQPAALPNGGEKLVETAAEPPKRARGSKPPETPAEEKPAGKTYEELKTLIEPLVKADQGLEVKKVIAKYAVGGGGLKELAGLPQHHVAFEKDLAALSF